MASKAISRAEIPEELLSAKREAIVQFLREARPGPRLRAFAASSHPDDNIVGIGIGHKVTNGKLTARRCVRIYVERKIGETAIPKDFVALRKSKALAPTLSKPDGSATSGGGSQRAPAATAGQTRMFSRISIYW